MAEKEQPRSTFSEETASVQSHLQIMQGVIQRMASNSTSCKTWCITIVSAILVLTADKSEPDLVWLALFPTILFLMLDAYYLALEKAFRSSYACFIRKLHNNELHVEDLFSVDPEGELTKHQLDALKSFSIWGFYCALIALVGLANEIVLT